MEEKQKKSPPADGIEWEGKPGPDHQLTKDMLAKIKKCILEGKTLTETAKVCEISYSVLTDWKWKNAANLSDKIAGWKRDRILSLAERNIAEFLDMDVRIAKTIAVGDQELEVLEEDVGKTRIKADMSKFAAETLGKDFGYAKRSELTGAGGEALVPDKTVIKKAKDAIKGFLGN